MNNLFHRRRRRRLPIIPSRPVKPVDEPKAEDKKEEPKNSLGLTPTQMAIHYPHDIPKPPSNPE